MQLNQTLAVQNIIFFGKSDWKEIPKHHKNHHVYLCLISVITRFRGALYRQLSDFNSAIDDYLVAMDKKGHDYSNKVYKEAQRQLLLCYNDFAVECFR
jgi:hypothetical protein